MLVAVPHAWTVVQAVEERLLGSSRDDVDDRGRS